MGGRGTDPSAACGGEGVCTGPALVGGAKTNYIRYMHRSGTAGTCDETMELHRRWEAIERWMDDGCLVCMYVCVCACER